LICIHGLDENNCPTCRIIRSTIPKNVNMNEKFNNEALKPKNPFFNNYLVQKNSVEKDLVLNKTNIRPKIIHKVPKPNLINQLPNFENNLNLERLSKLEIENYDSFGISKKISLGNPKLDLEDEE